MPKPARKDSKKPIIPTRPSSQNLSLTDRATRTVRDNILDLSLSPGMTLDERYLLEHFEFGRTPMREAMNRLIVEGLVVSRGARGVQVAPLNLESAIELFDAYVLAERMVASTLKFEHPTLVSDLEKVHADYVQNMDGTNLLRITELNVQFHGKLAEATENTHIETYSNKLHNLARRLSYFIYKREAESEEFAPVLFDKPRQDHERIIEAIRNRDRTMLVDLLTAHAVFFRTRLARIINQDRSASIDFTVTTEDA